MLFFSMNLHREITFQLFFWNQIKGRTWSTISGDEMEILDTGEWNFSDGPDFKNVTGKLNGQLWKGDVEIHTHAEDWYLHGHQRDKAYDQVKLHVVYHLGNHEKWPSIPTVVLQNQWNPMPEVWILPLVNPAIFNWETKAARWENWIQNFGGYDAKMIAISRVMGRHIQGDAMEQWAKQIPWSRIPAHWSVVQLHAFFHFMAGHLDGPMNRDSYVELLIQNQEVFDWAMDLPRQEIDWRRKVSMYARSGLKMAQMAQLFAIIRAHPNQEWWSAQGMRRALENLDVPLYWKINYQLGRKMAQPQPIVLSASAIESITNNLCVFILEENSSSLKKIAHHDQNDFRLL